LGGVSESYNYDAYGNLIAGNGSENPYLFAGEQRNVETGLDYLRARYYDPTLGRFISRDAYQGSLDDPMSQHKYQYAHANPVVNTDPSGYFSLTEFAAYSALYSSIAGISFTTGAAGAVLAFGGSFGDALALYDQFFAGMADSLTFGISTFARRLIHGEEATRNHRGLFFTLGRYAGGISNVWIGSYAAPLRSFQAAPWWAKAALGYDLFGMGAGIFQSTINVAKGQATWWDILPFLTLLPLFSTKVRLNSKGLEYNSGGRNFEISPSRITPDVPRNAIPDNNIHRFPNLMPEDAPKEILHPGIIKDIFFDGTKWRYTNRAGQIRSPKGLYNFVTIDGKIRIAREQPNFGGHIDISGGRSVDFAGSVRFGHGKTTKGKIKAWDNGSGHYKPYADLAHQAGFPLDLFRSYY